MLLIFFQIAQPLQKCTTLWSIMAQTVDFSPSNSGMKLIGNDVSAKLRDGEQGSSYVVSHLLLALRRGLPDIRIEELLILKARLCWIAPVISSFCMYRACVMGQQRGLGVSVWHLVSCSCTWLRMWCVPIWGSRVLWRFVKEELAGISRRTGVQWHFWESSNTPGKILWSKSCSYSAAETVLRQLYWDNLSLMMNVVFWNI